MSMVVTVGEFMFKTNLQQKMRHFELPILMYRIMSVAKKLMIFNHLRNLQFTQFMLCTC